MVIAQQCSLASMISSYKSHDSQLTPSNLSFYTLSVQLINSQVHELHAEYSGGYQSLQNKNLFWYYLSP